MYLEVDFQDGSVGKYPFSRGATVTIQEPDQVDSNGLQGPGPSFKFAVADVVGVGLKQDELSPQPAADPTPVAVEAPVPSTPPADPSASPSDGSSSPSSDASTPAGDPTTEDAPADPSTPPADGSSSSESDAAPADSSTPTESAPEATSIAAADTVDDAKTAAGSELSAVTDHEDPATQLAHAQAIAADLNAAIEKFGADQDLGDALTLINSLIADLTPESA